MTVLLLVEENRGEVLDATARALTATKKMADETHTLCVGEDCGKIARKAAKLDGVDKVLCANDAIYSHMLAEPVAALMAEFSENYTHIVAAASACGQNILARLAGLLDVMIVSDISSVIDEQTFSRPIYAGNAIQNVRSTESIKLITIRTSCFSAAVAGDTAPIEHITSANDPKLSVWLEDKFEKSPRVDLGSAKIVLAGGRGIGSAENFATLERIADRLAGAAVGATRAVVEMGYATNDIQIGQTGKIVAPDSYIALGISGAIQHLAGMKDSKIIVAINKDAQAPIFKIADFGLVADLSDALPELEKLL